jgi:hypothetical protein
MLFAHLKRILTLDDCDYVDQTVPAMSLSWQQQPKTSGNSPS